MVVGAGGHAAVVISSLLKLDLNVIGATSSETPRDVEVLGVPVVGGDEEIFAKHPSNIILANGIGATEPGRTARYFSATKMRARDYEFYTLIDPSALVGPEVIVGEGAQILAGTLVQTRTQIGNDSIINSGAQIDHDCNIGDCCHICPGTILAGGVHVGPRTIIGAGTTVIPGITIGADCLIAAGSVIFEDIPPGSRVVQKRATSFLA